MSSDQTNSRKQNSSGKTSLSVEGLEKLNKEYALIKSEKLRTLEVEIEKIREFGGEDVLALVSGKILEKEYLEDRVEELERIFSNYQILSNGISNHVHLGSVVVVESEGKETTFEIVESIEADPQRNKISLESPVGQALVDKTVGEIVQIHLPAAKLTYRIVSVT